MRRVRSAGATGGVWAGGGGSACGARSPAPADAHTNNRFARAEFRAAALRAAAPYGSRSRPAAAPRGHGPATALGGARPRALRARAAGGGREGGLREAEARMTRTVGEGRCVRPTDRGRCSAAEPSGGGAWISILVQQHCRRRASRAPRLSIDWGAGKGGGAIPPEGASEQGRAGRAGSAPAAATPARTRRTTAPLARRHAPLHRRCLRNVNPIKSYLKY